MTADDELEGTNLMTDTDLTEQIAHVLDKALCFEVESDVLACETTHEERLRIAQTVLPLIEAAVLAERERCAEIAEQPILYDYVHCATPEGLSEPGSPYDRGRQFQAKRIAADIRNQQ